MSAAAKQAPPTVRDVLCLVFGAKPVNDAARRVYRAHPDGGFACADGLCALGVMAERAGMDLETGNPRFPVPQDILLALPGEKRALRYHARTRRALWRVINANDAGDLARPGALRDLLATTLEDDV